MFNERLVFRSFFFFLENQNPGFLYFRAIMINKYFACYMYFASRQIDYSVNSKENLISNSNTLKNINHPIKNSQSVALQAAVE